MDGGHAAFASAADQKRGVDLHAIIKGANYDFTVVVLDEDVYRVPAHCEDCVVLGVEKDGFNIYVVEIPDEALLDGDHRGGIIEIDAAHKALRSIETFAQRLG